MSKIAPFPHHYSMQNSSTVYDEESLTTLEAIGRLGHKVNEVITAVNGWNVPHIVNVSPTGDVTGELDRAVIQGKLDKGYAVHLSAGEYYLNSPLIFRPGYMLRGDGQLNTVINCKTGFIDHESIVSVDHVEVRDIRVKGAGEGVGIDISRKVEGIETGGRYAHFMNVYISGYETGVKLGGCWCTNFTHCRIEAENICVEQRGSCNHVRYDHCMFLGPVDAKTTTGVKITAEDGAENYGITFDHCEFERHDKAIHAYYCIALNVSAIYAEGVNTIFQLDSCPGFLCDGGYLSHPERVCNTARSNTSPVFSKCSGAVKNLYVKVNTPDTFYLVSTGANAPLDVENINCVNAGVGECIINAQCANSIWNGHEYHLVNKALIPLPYFLNGTPNYFFNAEYGASERSCYTINGYMNKPNNRFKLQEVSVVFTNAERATVTKSVSVELSVLRQDIGGATGEAGKATDRIVLMRGYLNVDDSLYEGKTVKLTPVVDSYRDLILSNVGNLKVDMSDQDYTDLEVPQANVSLTMVSGEMIL